MAATKKVAVKQATKDEKLTRSRRRRSTDRPDDGVYWVVSQRQIVTWKPFAVFKSKELAEAARDTYESQSNKTYKSYKVDRVQLLDTPGNPA